MPAINATIVVDQTNLTITPTTTNLGVTVEPINLGIFTTSPTPPGGSIGQLQYNATGVGLGGVANTSVANGNITFTNLSNVKIDGGTNAYYLQTDGTGNLTWAAGGTPTGSGVPSGANTQIQLSDGSGAFDSGAGFTFDNASNVFTTPGLAVFVGNVDSTSGIFNGDGGGLANIQAANVVGSLGTSKISNGLSNVEIATADGNVDFTVGGANVARMSTTGAAYPGFLAVNGNITAENDIATTAGNIDTTSGIFNGDGGGISNIAFANIAGDFANVTLVGTTTIQQVKEKVTVDATPATGTINYDLLDQAILFNTANATANFTLNFRGNTSTTLDSIMSSNQSITCSFINPNDTNAYYANVIQVDGTTITPKWPTVPGGSSTADDFYPFNIIKTAASTFSVFVSNQGFS